MSNNEFDPAKANATPGEPANYDFEAMAKKAFEQAEKEIELSNQPETKALMDDKKKKKEKKNPAAVNPSKSDFAKMLEEDRRVKKEQLEVKRIELETKILAMKEAGASTNPFDDLNKHLRSLSCGAIGALVIQTMILNGYDEVSINELGKVLGLAHFQELESALVSLMSKRVISYSTGRARLAHPELCELLQKFKLVKEVFWK